MNTENESVSLELELPNGKKILRNFIPSKCYDFVEKTINRYSFCKSFPFIRKTKSKVTVFSYQSVYYDKRSYEDDRYIVNCKLTTLLNALGRHVKSWEQILMEGTIKYGDEND